MVHSNTLSKQPDGNNIPLSKPQVLSAHAVIYTAMAVGSTQLLPVTAHEGRNRPQRDAGTLRINGMVM
jgi:hypothetical protein